MSLFYQQERSLATLYDLPEPSDWSRKRPRQTLPCVPVALGAGLQGFATLLLPGALHSCRRPRFKSLATPSPSTGPLHKQWLP